jgi:hypothetical protein
MNLYISESVQDAIADAAEQVQVHLEQEKGVHYSVNDLKNVLVKWLELSIEQLAEEAMYHCLEGDRAYAFNRCGFTQALEKLTPAYTPQQADELVA